MVSKSGVFCVILAPALHLRLPILHLVESTRTNDAGRQVEPMRWIPRVCGRAAPRPLPGARKIWVCER